MIHEVGHVLTLYSIGIMDVTVRINPLTESHVVPAVGIHPEHLLYMSLSGMVFQAIVCSAISIAAWRRRSRQLFPLLICGPMALINIGGYLTVGLTMEGGVSIMLRSGVPPQVVLIVGGATLILGAASFVFTLSVVGFSRGDSYLKTFTSLFLGMGFYSAAMLVYGVFLSDYGPLIGVINIVSSVVSARVFTVALKKGYSLMEPFHIKEYSEGLAEMKILGMGIICVVLSIILT